MAREPLDPAVPLKLWILEGPEQDVVVFVSNQGEIGEEPLEKYFIVDIVEISAMPLRREIGNDTLRHNPTEMVNALISLGRAIDPDHELALIGPLEMIIAAAWKAARAKKPAAS